MTPWLLLLGCRQDDGQPVPGEPPIHLYGGGDRLEARTELFSVAEHLVGFHDRELDVDCAFEALPGPDGRVRCVPDAQVTAAGFFADAACSEPVVSDAEPGDLVHDAPADTCATEVGWYVAGGPSEGVWARDEIGGDCVEVPDITGVRLDPLDGEAFVAADLVIEPRGAVDAWIARADDGAWQVVSGWAGELGTPVGRFGYGAGATGEVWWPRLYLAYVYDVLFADPECGEPVAQKFPADAACPVLFAITFEASEPPLYRTGEELDPGALFTRSETTGDCVDAALDASPDLFFALGDVVTDGELEPIVEELSGSGRIRRRVLGSEGGEPVMLADPPFWDEELDAPCGPSTALDPVRTYCAPPAVTEVGYADSRCDELVAELPEVATSWGAVSIAYDEGVQVQRLADEVDRVWRTTFTSGSAECVRLDDEEKVGRIYRRLGSEIPVEGLVPAFP